MFARLPIFSTLSALLGGAARALGLGRRGLMGMVWALVVALAVFTVEHPALAEDFEEEVEAELSIATLTQGAGHDSSLSAAPGASPAVPHPPGELPDMALPLPVFADMPVRMHSAPHAPSPAIGEPASGPLLRPPIA